MSQKSAPKPSGFKVKFPIGVKLVSMMALLLITSILTVVFLATKLFSDDNTAFIQKATSDVAAQLASQTNEYIKTLANTLTTITEFQASQTKGRSVDFLDQQFERNPEILSVATWRKGDTRPERLSLNPKSSDIKTFVESVKPSDRSWEGEPDLDRVTFNGTGYLAVSFPLAVENEKQVVTSAVGLITAERFVQIYGKKGVVTSYLVGRKGDVLAHPKEQLVSQGVNFSDVPIVKAMLESSLNNNQLRFEDKDNLAYLGAFRQVGIAGVGVISQVLEEKAFETANRVKYRSLLVAGVIMFLAFSFVYFFSQTMTKPIKSLVELTKEIASGNFAVKVQPKGHDEITALTHSFKDMATGLAERDKLKETFNKFHSKEIAEAILSGEVKLGGSRQRATVFFSDIRSFTEMSESMNPEEVVQMLNEYMTVMVAEITANKGVVDKYVGDAIMAVWGVPMSKPNDTWNAVKACFDMRRRLAEFNEGRIAKGLKPLKIGMGLHSGELIAGNIGSNEKMEYTVIGDTVNTASRIESLTKEFGTDLLISADVYGQLKDRLIVEPVSASVKGKADALTAYKVKGYYDENKSPVVIETPYSSYEASHSDKVVHQKKSA
ncbi:MAG: HAMP domain-containing protein [Oligoflexia bacterium]|nr:HAMP domain-containing protein [Oligoflexia bacterium]